MKKFNGKYEKICEETLSRYQQMGFLSGDSVKLKKDALSHDVIKMMSEQVKSLLSTALKEGSSFKISAIKSGKPEAFSGPLGASNIPSCHTWADIYHEYAPGMFNNVLTVPLEILEKVDVEGANGYPQYDKKLVRPNVVEPTADKEMLKQTEGDKRKMPSTDNKPAHTPKPKDGRDGLKKPKKLRESDTYKKLRENDLIFEQYTNKK